MLTLLVFLATYVCRGRSRARKSALANGGASGRSSGTELRASSVEAGTSEYEKVDHLLDNAYDTPPVVSTGEYDVAPPEVSYAPAPGTMRSQFSVHAYGEAQPNPSDAYESVNAPIGDGYDAASSRLDA